MFPGWQFFCNESTECLSSISYRYFLSLLATTPVAPMITGIIKHFMFHIRWISMLNLYILISFPLLYVLHSYLLALIRGIIYQCAIFFSFVFDYYIWPVYQNLSLCLYILVLQYRYIFIFAYWLRYIRIPVIRHFSSVFPTYWLIQMRADFIMSYYSCIVILCQNWTSWY
jgi:hypothetical protein